MWIRGGRIIDPASGTDMVGDLLIADGRIEKIVADGAPASGDEVLDARGLWVMPGLVDIHVHFRDPGLEYKEDIRSGSMAAAAGGVTTVACMANTDPVNDNASVTKYIVDKAENEALVRVLPVGAVTKGLAGRELAEMGLMKKAGIVAVSDDGMPIQDSGLLRRALEYAANFDLPLMSHCQDRDLSGDGVMNEGALSSELGLPGLPSAAEDVQVARDIEVAAFCGIPIHISHVSTKGAVELIRQAKQAGKPLTCEVSPHHLLLTEERVRNYDTNAKMYPPLRREDDRQALIAALKDGLFDCIATDHAPHAPDEKALDFEHAPNGILGLQTLLPAILKLHREEGLDFKRLLECVTVNPARLLKIDAGTLAPGARADLALVDPEEVWTLSEDLIASRSVNSPFIGETFTGRVRYTLVDGQVVFRAD